MATLANNNSQHQQSRPYIDNSLQCARQQHRVRGSRAACSYRTLWKGAACWLRGVFFRALSAASSFSSSSSHWRLLSGLLLLPLPWGFSFDEEPPPEAAAAAACCRLCEEMLGGLTGRPALRCCCCCGLGLGCPKSPAGFRCVNESPPLADECGTPLSALRTTPEGEAASFLPPDAAAAAAAAAAWASAPPKPFSNSGVESRAQSRAAFSWT